ncbi:TOPRIM nucleotidyl transferase/hydrolase domain-containing protein [Micromonospora sp. NPDC023644]|uniref:ATP-dependent nuclease n=1 Tax=Micromonospora sp. NPDC023644 TaxID=3154321 RepID=UPI0033FF13A8
MRLASMTVRGFRSLGDVGPIPIRRPTILAGHNDSGKTACLDALAFLLGVRQVTDEDRTFASISAGPGDPLLNPESGEDREARVSSTSVEGFFLLTSEEQSSLGLSNEVRIRRTADSAGLTALEIEATVPADPNLRDLDRKNVAQLKQLAAEHSIPIRSNALKPEIHAAVADYASSQPQVVAWANASAEVVAAMPRLLRFGDATSAELAVKAALANSYKSHLDDEDLRGRVQELEDELRSRVRADAVGLVNHIQARCPDLVVVEVDPDISFNHGLRATRLRLAKVDGEEVSIASSGAGRARRISLAIWEWTSDVLRGRVLASNDGPPTIPDIVIAYDEPDTHLDYLQQRRVMKLIREQCQLAGVGMVVATHSMNLIDGAAVDDIIHLKLVDERTTMERLLDESDDEKNNHHLADIAAALGLRNTVLLHERCFVGVEGPSEQQAMPILFRLATGRSLQSAGIVIVGCNNNDGALLFAGHLAKNGRQVALVVDADSRKTKYFSDARLVAAGLDPKKHLHLIGEPDKELEFVFTDEQWASVANAAWPRNDGESWSAGDVEGLRSKKKFSDELLTMFKEGSEEGPSRKTAMVYELVSRLKSREEIPQEILSIFSDLEDLAALDS